MTGATESFRFGPSARASRASALTDWRTGDWPRTTRILPWSIAVFLVMLFLIPFDSIQVPIHLPVDSAVDRFVLGFMFIAWVVTAVAGQQRPRFKHAPINVAIFALVTVCVLSLATNLRDLTWAGELGLSVKQLSLVISYLAFFFIVATSVRRTEVVAFATLALGLAVLTAIGTIYQYRSGTNLFAQLGHDIFAGAKLTLKRHIGHGALARKGAAGPTLHPLADATLLSAAVPVAIVLGTHAKRRSTAILMAVATVVLLAGCVSTGRKTALIVPVVSIVVLVAYQPRRYLKYWPLAIVAVIAIRLAAPHAISQLLYQVNSTSSSSSTATRTGDYAAVAPYIESHLLFGRGYGSFDPVKYRVLDDQMLGFLVQIGVLGTLAYAAVIVMGAATVHRAARRRADLTDALMAAVVAVSAGFLVSNFLYDAFGFRQGPYIFFFFAALGVAHVGEVWGPRAETAASVRAAAAE